MTDNEKVTAIIEYAQQDPDCYDDLIRYIKHITKHYPEVIQPVYDFIKKNPGLGSNHVLAQVCVHDPECVMTEEDYYRMWNEQ